MKLTDSGSSWYGWSSLSSSDTICWSRVDGFGGLRWLLGLLGRLALEEVLDLGLKVGQRVGCCVGKITLADALQRAWQTRQ